MRVLIADGHQGMREVLCASLSGCGIQVVSLAADCLEAVEKARTLAPDVVILDFQMMPRGAAPEAARLIQSEIPLVRIIMLTTWDEEVYRRAAANCGAIACFPKYVPTRDLISAMKAAQSCEAVGTIADTQRPPPLGARIGMMTWAFQTCY